MERRAQNAAVRLDPFMFEDFEKDYVRHSMLFKQRKIKKIFEDKQSEEFAYEPFFKRFSILPEEIKDGTIGIAYLVYIKKLLREARISTAVN